VGAWRRRSICVPGGRPIEPCEAWWIQGLDVFVDVRVTLPGHHDNDLPYSSTRVFAGRFEIADGEARWHVHLDSDGIVPRVDRAAAGGLYIDPGDPRLMIEDAPGRFREEWEQRAAAVATEAVSAPDMVAVRVGDVCGVVMAVDGRVSGRVWHQDGSIGFAPA
jgi:hypothetical protein